jgi:flavoprotein
VVVAPATSNTVAKCVWGISDTLVTNIFAQAGKCRIPSIVFACDTEPEVTTESPSDWVTLYPRSVDLENVEKLKAFERVTVASTLEELRVAIQDRIACLSTSSS